MILFTVIKYYFYGADKYPDITVNLIGQDGNAFSILGKCRRAMIQNRLPQSEIDEFTQQATSGNYDHLLCTCMDWFNVE